MKKFLSVVLALAFASLAFASGKGTVGIAMPTRSAQRWLSDGESVKKGVEALGYQADLQYGDDVIENQVNQIENMITKGVKVLVIASIDGSSLTDVLEKAHEAGIPVIAYDRLIRNSPYVDYYVSFDNYKVGQQMGDILIKGLELDKATTAKPKIIEVFGGSPDDNNAYFFYNGAMDNLKPYFDKGVLKIGSGQQGMDVVGTLRWDGAAAQARMENLLSAYYTNQTLDGALSPYDPISLGILQACKGVGYGSAGKPLPIVGGQDADLASIKSIIAGEQYATVFKDTRSLAAATVEMLKAIMAGQKPEVNNTTDYENGSTKDGKPYIVPSMLLQSTAIFKENAVSELVEKTGYYTKDQLGVK
ncbi:MAG: sugar-binding protein [Fusobacteriaceae bacterium]|jgi:putative multiple sugar transport system substrate-binding protein|nr:sugar-binding protein [Fusobacteriaceae bacterium]